MYYVENLEHINEKGRIPLEENEVTVVEEEQHNQPHAEETESQELWHRMMRLGCSDRKGDDDV